MTNLFVQAIVVAAIAIAAWWLTERFSPDALLTKLVKLAIFVFVVIWFVLKVLPKVL